MNVSRAIMKRLFPLSFFLLLMFACGPKYKTKDVDQQNGFYFWKTNPEFSQKQYDHLDSLNTQVVYLKLFDVGWDEYNKVAVPMGEVSFYNVNPSPYRKYEVIPTIFITNEALKNIKENEVELLSNKVYRKILTHFVSIASNESGAGRYFDGSDPYYQTSPDFRELIVKDSLSKAYFNRVTEFQFDCDWTESTRDKYFSFLKLMKQKLEGKLISSTIRLYPYKYPDKAGVPPVDKGMLMCYNVGNVLDVESGNSIFDKKEVYKYIKTKNVYPLPLDYAFPVFEWCSIYHKGKLVKLIPLENFSYQLDYYKDISKGEIKKYEVLQDYTMYPYDFKIQKGDIIKVESLPFDDVVEVASYISSKNTNKNARVVLFDYDENSIRRNEESVKKIFDCF